jgi:hypothetical protein
MPSIERLHWYSAMTSARRAPAGKSRNSCRKIGLGISERRSTSPRLLLIWPLFHASLVRDDEEVPEQADEYAILAMVARGFGAHTIAVSSLLRLRAQVVEASGLSTFRMLGTLYNA